VVVGDPAGEIATQSVSDVGVPVMVTAAFAPGVIVVAVGVNTIVLACAEATVGTLIIAVVGTIHVTNTKPIVRIRWGRLRKSAVTRPRKSMCTDETIPAVMVCPLSR
jgi:hypothetical protein